MTKYYFATLKLGVISWKKTQGGRKALFLTCSLLSLPDPIPSPASCHKLKVMETQRSYGLPGDLNFGCHVFKILRTLTARNIYSFEKENKQTKTTNKKKDDNDNNKTEKNPVLSSDLDCFPKLILNSRNCQWVSGWVGPERPVLNEITRI